MYRKLKKLTKDPSLFFIDMGKKWRRRFLLEQKSQSDHFLMAYNQNVIKTQTIVYESFHGSKIADSPYALYLEIISDTRFANYKHYWVASNDKQIPEIVRYQKSTKCIKRNSKEYAKLLGTAEFLINNSTFPDYYIRRDGQKYINTWHGVPLKHMFKDEKGKWGGFANSQRNFLQATHFVTPNKYTTKVILGRSDAEKIYAGRVLETGLPRSDLTVYANKDAIRSRLGISTSRKPILLYAPTWRGRVGRVKDESAVLKAKVEKLCNELGSNYHIFFSAHNFIEKQFEHCPVGARFLPGTVDVNEFIGITDVLVTDYSSIMFDFMSLNKRCYIHNYDYEKYKEERGLYMELSNLPTVIEPDLDKLIGDIISKDKDEVGSHELEEFNNTHGSCLDGECSKRVIESVFFGSTKWDVKARKDKNKKIIIFPGGWKNNGITNSVLNLVNNIVGSRCDVFVVCDRGAVTRDKEREKNVRKLPDNVGFVPRIGRLVATKQEQRELDRFYRTNTFESEKQQRVITGIFEREWRRLLGDAQFDCSVDFSGYARFWALLMASGSVGRKLIFQHNEMWNEANRRFPVLHGVFETYKLFDEIVCVSEQTALTNERELFKHIGQRGKNIVVIPNTLNLLDIERKKKEKTNFIEGLGPCIITQTNRRGNVWSLCTVVAPSKSDYNFVTVGRLSPEKCHIKLLDAFAEIVNTTNKKTKLYILGDGPMRDRITLHIRENKLESSVVLAGQVQNPYIFLAHCDCFVLPSDYEGQPMVLLEALAMEKNVIATDIPGSRSVLADKFGVLVENSVPGLVGAMQRALSGEMFQARFDANSYNKLATDRFLEIAFKREQRFTNSK